MNCPHCNEPINKEWVNDTTKKEVWRCRKCGYTKVIDPQQLQTA